MMALEGSRPTAPRKATSSGGGHPPSQQAISIMTIRLTWWSVWPIQTDSIRCSETGVAGLLCRTFTFLSGGSVAAVADFNADGKADVAGVSVVAGTNFVRIFTGNGAGIFTGFVDIITPGSAGSVIARDLNGDGKPDIAIVNTVLTPKA